MPKVAIQGEKQSFHDIAAHKWYDKEPVDILPLQTFREVFCSLSNQEADVGVIAIENSLYGSINEVYDLIEKYRYPIIGEIHLAVHQQLIGLKNSKLDTITKVYSHPVALAQCEAWLDEHLPADVERIEYHDTAAAAEHISLQKDTFSVAIASRQAADLYRLDILAKNIEDNPSNFTNFLIIQPNALPPADADRSMIVITTNHVPGALAKVLTVFANLSINLAKLQSRPIIGEPWRYRFYLVLETAGKDLSGALDAIKDLTTSIVVLGEYRHNL
jgi:prephenate dehydratase